MGGTNPHGDMHHVPNTVTSVLKRIAVDVPRSSKHFRDAWFGFVDDWVRANITPLAADADLSVDTWISGTPYTGARKAQLKRLHDELLPDINPEYTYRRGERTTDVHFFTKDESYSSYKMVRQIYARVDEYKLLVGPFFHHLEKSLYAHESFIKLIPIQERPNHVLRWLRAGDNYRYVATDYTAYECHFTSHILERVEGALYRWFSINNAHARRIVEIHQRVTTGINRCTSKGLRVEIPARRMSGEMCTSLGNGFTNLMVFEFIRHVFGRAMHDSRVVIEGDDALYNVARVCFGCDCRNGRARCPVGGFVQRIHTLGAKCWRDFQIAFARRYPPSESVRNGCHHFGYVVNQDQLIQVLYDLLGFNVKIEFHENVYTAGFCSMTFDTETLVVVPSPMKKILNFGWVAAKYKFSSVKTRTELLRGKAMSLMAESRGVPILQSMAMCYIRLTHGKHFRIDDYWTRQKMKRSNLEPMEVSMSTRLIMQQLHGFSVEEQLELERFFDGHNDLGPFTHPVLLSRLTDDQVHSYQHFVFAVDVGDNPTVPLPMKIDIFMKKKSIKKTTPRVASARAVSKPKKMVGPRPRREGKSSASMSLDGLVIEKKELVGYIEGSTDFRNNVYEVSLTNQDLFPWLSSISNNFAEWKSEYIRFHFESTSSNALNSTNTALGQVVMCANYDVKTPVFNSLFAAMQDPHSRIAKPATSFVYDLDWKSAFVGRDGKLFVQGGSSERSTTLAKFQIITQGMQASAQIGVLYISYKIRFYKPVVPPVPLALQTNMVGHFDGSTFGPWPADVSINTIGKLKTSVTRLSTQQVIVNLPFREIDTYYTVEVLLDAHGTTLASGYTVAMGGATYYGTYPFPYAFTYPAQSASMSAKAWMGLILVRAGDAGYISLQSSLTYTASTSLSIFIAQIGVGSLPPSDDSQLIGASAIAGAIPVPTPLFGETLLSASSSSLLSASSTSSGSSVVSSSVSVEHKSEE